MLLVLSGIRGLFHDLLSHGEHTLSPLLPGVLYSQHRESDILKSGNDYLNRMVKNIQKTI